MATLPETAEIAAVTAERRAVADQARDARITVDDLTAAQKKADSDVEAVRTRRRRDQERMDSGAVSNPKDLERMQHELATLDRRIGVLEDEELELMEQLEEAQTALTALEERVAGFDERLAELAASRDEKAAGLEAQLAEVAAERPSTVEGMPADLLALYDKLREAKGIGAAELRARRCGGCQLELDAAELARIKGLPSNEVVRCEECSRILVRTAESGL
ncbi:C4-type zinc ribbon domain-containing protein [Nocardioides sp. CER19]|uniref:zinc ribbon domain-containing protein n=1 Tax=Nocardioides sp. CER19 TaxID=3038538 RepID=UPI00244CEF31|nr:C4-type zinc ribbon domain-containing protein [Nocardioides sp. CER19]MDH2416256.1 C4-type zinc ribbon domain-containing protein [Nocardioides sp. CER19]